MPTKQPQPFLSAVVRSDGRPEPLRRTLAALGVQTLPRESFEVLVVDAGAAGDAAEVARAFERELPLRHVVERQPGAAAARNRGTLLARGTVVLFVDAGDAPCPGSLEAHCEAHRDHPGTAHAVLGAAAVAASPAADPLASFLAERERAPLPGGGATDGDVPDFTLFRAARASCKRALLAGGARFDPALEAGCEDVELAQRLAARGLRLVFRARATTEIAPDPDFDAQCEEHRRLGRAQRALARVRADPALDRWTDLAGARRVWSSVAPVHDALLRSARELDRLVRLRRRAGVTVEPWDLALLHRGYWTAFRACRARGAAEEGGDLQLEARPGHATSHR